MDATWLDNSNAAALPPETDLAIGKLCHARFNTEDQQAGVATRGPNRCRAALNYAYGMMMTWK